MAEETQWRHCINQPKAAQSTDAAEGMALLVLAATRVIVGTLVMVGMLGLMTVMTQL